MAELKFEITADSSAFDKALNDSIAKVRKWASETDASGKDIDKCFRDLGAQIAETLGEVSIDKLESALKDAVDSVQGLNEKMAQMKGADGFDEQSDEAKKLAVQIETANQKANEYKQILAGAQNVKFPEGPDPKGFEDTAKAIDASTKSAKGLNGAFQLLPQGLQNAVGGFKKLIQASKAFILTPIGAVITAIAGALATLKTYFTSSAEGQQVFAKASAYVGSVLSSLKDVVIGIGDKIVKLFTEPKKAVQDFGSSLKTFVLDRINGLGKMLGGLGGAIKSIFNKDWDGLKDNLQQVKDGFKEANPLNTVKKGIEDFGKKASESASKMAELADREYALRKRRSKWQIEEANLDNKIAEARNKMYESKDAETRLKATAEAQELIRQKYEKQIAMAKEELAIVKAQNHEHTNATEDYEKVDTLTANIVRLEAQMNQELSRFIRQETSASATALKTEQERQRLELETATKRLEFEDDSLAKSIALLEIEQQRADLELKQQEQTWREESGNGTLTDAQQNYLDSMRDLYKQFSSTQIERLIFDQYASALQKAEKAYGTAGDNIQTLKNKGASKEIIDSAIEQQQMQALEVMKERVDAKFIAWTNSLAKMTTASLEKELTVAEAFLLEKSSMEGVTDGDLIEARARVALLKEEVKKAQQQIGKNPDTDSLENLSTICKDGADGFKALGQSSNEAFNDIMNSVGDVLDTVQTVIAGIQQLTESAIDAEKRTAEEGASAVKAVEDISVILAIIGAVVSLANKLKSTKANDPLKAISDSAQDLTKSLRDLQVQMDLTLNNGTMFGDNAKANMSQSIENIRKYGQEYQKALEDAVVGANQSAYKESWGITNAGSTFYSSFAEMAEKQKELFGESAGNDMKARLKDLNKYEISINGLAQALMDYEVQTEHSTMFRKAKYSTVGNLLKDFDLVGKTEEETLANLKKFATEGGKEWEKLYEPVKRLVEDTIRYADAQQEALQQLDDAMRGYFGNYTNVLKDAIKTGMEQGSAEGKKAFNDNVSAMIGDFYLDMLLGKDKVAEMLSGMTDEVGAMLQSNTDDKEIAKYMAQKAKEVSNEYNSIKDLYSSVMDEVNATLGTGADIANMGTMSGAIQGASQESIDLLSGYCNAVRINQTDSINIMREQLVQLSGINQNTLTISDLLYNFKTAVETYINGNDTRAIGG